MAQITISKGSHTVASIKASLSSLGTCKVWQGGDVTRIYVGQVYAQIADDKIIVGNKLKASTGLSQAANLIQASDAAIIEPTASQSAARRWDNLQNEGARTATIPIASPRCTAATARWRATWPQREATANAHHLYDPLWQRH